MIFNGGGAGRGRPFLSVRAAPGCGAGGAAGAPGAPDAASPARRAAR